jgi:hypothetical protein
MQIVKELTQKARPLEAKKAFAGSLVARKVGEQQALQRLSNRKLLRLARKHAPDLLGAYAPKPAAKTGANTG